MKLYYVIMFLIPPAVVGLAMLFTYLSYKKTGNAKKALRTHFASLAAMVVMLLCVGIGVSADEVEETALAAADSARGLGYIAAGLCTGLAAIGGGMALASGIPAAIGATSEDPKNFGKALIFVALGETLALYGFIISFIIISAL